jgi:hypothetical protein
MWWGVLQADLSWVVLCSWLYGWVHTEPCLLQHTNTN